MPIHQIPYVLWNYTVNFYTIAWFGLTEFCIPLIVSLLGKAITHTLLNSPLCILRGFPGFAWLTNSRPYANGSPLYVNTTPHQCLVSSPVSGLPGPVLTSLRAPSSNAEARPLHCCSCLFPFLNTLSPALPILQGSTQIPPCSTTAHGDFSLLHTHITHCCQYSFYITSCIIFLLVFPVFCFPSPILETLRRQELCFRGFISLLMA